MVDYQSAMVQGVADTGSKTFPCSVDDDSLVPTKATVSRSSKFGSDNNDFTNTNSIMRFEEDSSIRVNRKLNIKTKMNKFHR